jgi:hypothetical protein
MKVQGNGFTYTDWMRSIFQGNKIIIIIIMISLLEAKKFLSVIIIIITSNINVCPSRLAPSHSSVFCPFQRLSVLPTDLTAMCNPSTV